MSDFPSGVPYTRLAELVSMLRGQTPAKAAEIAAKALWCAGCLIVTFDGLPDVPVPQPFVVGSSMSVSSATTYADTIERAVADSKSVSANAAGKAPPWMAALWPILWQLIQQYWIKNNPSIVPVP